MKPVQRLRRAFQQYIRSLHANLVISIFSALAIGALIYVVLIDSSVRTSHDTLERIAVDFADSLFLFAALSATFETVHSTVATERTRAIAKEVFGPLHGTFLELSEKQHIIREEIKLEISLEEIDPFYIREMCRLTYFFYNKARIPIQYTPTVEYDRFPSAEIQYFAPVFRIAVYAPDRGVQMRRFEPPVVLSQTPSIRLYTWQATFDVQPRDEAYYQFQADWMHVSNRIDFYDLILTYWCQKVRVVVNHPTTMQIEAFAVGPLTTLELDHEPSSMNGWMSTQEWSSIGPCLPGQSFRIIWRPRGGPPGAFIPS